MAERITIGTLEELRRTGCLTGKAGTQPICVLWSDDAAFAVDDRCPHMGFPLHRGTLESGLLTCHWHNARFDVSSGGTLDPWADDVRAYPVEIDDGQVTVDRRRRARPHGPPVPAPAGRHGAGHHPRHRQGRPEAARCRRRAGRDRAVRGRLRHPLPRWWLGRRPHRADRDGQRARPPGAGGPPAGARARAGVRLPRHAGPAAVVPAAPARRHVPADRLGGWYRRFVETRSADAAERTLASAVATSGATEVADIMYAAVTDHVFIDGGHTIDFTTKAFEVLDHLGWDAAPTVLPTLAAQTAAASRSEERGAWRFPHDLAELIRTATAALPDRLAAARRRLRPRRRCRQAGVVDPVRGPDRGRRRHRRRDRRRRHARGARPRRRAVLSGGSEQLAVEENASPRTPPRVGSDSMRFPSRERHRRTTPSAPPVANSRPFGEKAAAKPTNESTPTVATTCPSPVVDLRALVLVAAGGRHSACRCECAATASAIAPMVSGTGEETMRRPDGRFQVSRCWSCQTKEPSSGETSPTTAASDPPSGLPDELLDTAACRSRGAGPVDASGDRAGRSAHRYAETRRASRPLPRPCREEPCIASSGAGPNTVAEASGVGRVTSQSVAPVAAREMIRLSELVKAVSPTELP